jgi:hypothetical protein
MTIPRNLCHLVLVLLGLVACAGGLLPAGCAGIPQSGPRPSGIPDTPYWFPTADSSMWYLPAESLVVIQLAPGSDPHIVTDVLYALRDLGWRMTVTRGPALRMGGVEQGLSQQLMQLERVGRAVSPTHSRGRIEARFWPRGHAGEAPLLVGILPGLRAFGREPVLYFWPSTLAVVWSKLTTAVQVHAWLDSLGCRTVTSPGFAHQYFVQRTWAVELPPGAELFTWLRRFDADPRVSLVYPIRSTIEPAAPDSRMARRLRGKDVPDPEGFEKLSTALQQAYYTANFSGRTAHVEGVQKRASELRVKITTTSSPTLGPDFVQPYGGELIKRGATWMEAWVPFSSIPDLVRDTSVQGVVEVK